MALSCTVSEIRLCIGRKSPNLSTPVGFNAPARGGEWYGSNVISLRHCTWGFSRLPYLYAKFRSRTLAGFCCTLLDAEEQEDKDEEKNEEETIRAIPIY